MIQLNILRRGMMSVLLALLLFVGFQVDAQRRNKKSKANTAQPAADPKADVYKGLEWRSIGPYRGGELLR